MTYRYIESLEWCWRYYQGLPVSMTSYYEFPEAPLVEDLVKYLPEFKAAVSDDSGSDFPSAESQLIAVLPEESFHLFPRHRMLEVVKELPEYYPTAYTQWTFLKMHEWMCVSILPTIDISRIESLLLI
jgi:5'-3' exonuclease